MRTTALVFVDPAATRERLDANLEWVGGCRVWTGAAYQGWGIIAVKLVDGGYRYGWRKVAAHRVAWTLERGPIPDGHVLDHICRNRRCCNVDHLQPVSQAENARRVIRETSPVCRRCGGTDWIVQGANRRCRACWNAYHREWQREHRPPKPCAWCGTPFVPTAQRRKLCSDECALQHGREYRRRAWHEVYKHRQ